jgi:hypothetical protein
MFHPPQTPDVTINVFYRGNPIAAESSNALRRIQQDKPAANGPEKLSPDEIRELSQVFGRNTVGDNQYTNDAPKGSHDYAVFHINTAETFKLNGQTVLKVAGTFQDENAVPVTEYQGYLFESKDDPQQIEEIFFQAPNKDKYLQYVKLFEDSLSSLQWR